MQGQPEPFKVLIVEDNVDAATSLGELLKLWEYQVSIVFSGSDAVPAAHRFNPDVVLLDIGLPGLSGYEVAKLMREDPALTLTILVALTAYNQDENRLEAEGARFDCYFVKPPDLHSLYDFLLTKQCA
jgi:two-component system, sensor histidine kinase